MSETLAHGNHLRVPSESYPMNTNLTGLGWFLFVFVLWTKFKVASALKGLTIILLGLIWPIQNGAKKLKIPEALALSNEYKHDMV